MASFVTRITPVLIALTLFAWPSAGSAQCVVNGQAIDLNLFKGTWHTQYGNVTLAAPQKPTANDQCTLEGTYGHGPRKTLTLATRTGSQKR